MFVLNIKPVLNSMCDPNIFQEVDVYSARLSLATMMERKPRLLSTFPAKGDKSG